MSEHFPLTNARIFILQKAYDPANVVANTQATNATTLTITGLLTTDFIHAIKPTQTQGLFLKGCSCTAANTASFVFENITGSDINPASETYTFLVFRPNGTIDDELT